MVPTTSCVNAFCAAVLHKCFRVMLSLVIRFDDSLSNPIYNNFILYACNANTMLVSLSSQKLSGVRLSYIVHAFPYFLKREDGEKV